MCRRKSSRPRRVILGIDPGTTGMGYALLDAATDPPTILESGIVRAAPAASDAERLVARAHVSVAEYTPQEVKLSVTGTGGADKKQVQRMLTIVLALAEPITEDNVADAVAIALAHAQRERFGAAVALASS